MSDEQDIKEVLDLLKEVFDEQTSCLRDHEEFAEIGEGKIKVFVREQGN